MQSITQRKDNRSMSMYSTGTSQHNDSLAQRQAEVRSALQELYGTVNQHDNHEDFKQEAHQQHSIVHSINPVAALDFGFENDDNTEVQSLSFDPLVLQDSDNFDGNYNPLHHDQHQNQNHDQHDEGGDGSSSVSSFSLSLLCDGSLGMEILPPPPDAADNTHSHNAHIDTNADESINLQAMQIVKFQQQIDELLEENNQLQEELEMQKAEKALLSPTKYQVQIDSMRYVAEQVQVEADEKIQILQRERDDMHYELQLLKKKQQQPNQPKESSNGENDRRVHIWEYAFHSLLEQMCLLEESGLRKDATLRMDHVIRDALVGIEMESGLSNDTSFSLEERMGMIDYLDRLAKGCGSTNELDSMVSDEGKDENRMNDTNRLGTVASSIARGSHGSESDETGKYVSVGVDTEDLQSMRLFSPATSSANASASMITTHFLHQTVSELHMENAGLKGSNEHMKEQIDRYKQQLQTMKDLAARDNSFVSPALGLRGGTTLSTQNDFKLRNAQLQQEIRILTENQRVVEEENCMVVQRCVEVENVAEDATHECEELMMKLADTEDELKKVEDERDELLILHMDYEEATNKDENEHIRFRDEMTNEFRALQERCDGLIQSRTSLEAEVESLREIEEELNAELKGVKEDLQSKCMELNSMQSELAHVQEQQPGREDTLERLTQECNVFKADKIELERQVEKLQQRNQTTGDLEDECSRLRNLNGMIKAKIEMTEIELVKVKEQNGEYARKMTSLQADYDNMRIENVSLSDCKTDLELEIKKSEKDLADRKSVVSRVERELGKVISIRDDLQTQNERLRQRLDNLQKQADTAMSSVKELKSENNAMKVKFSAVTGGNNAVGNEIGESQITNFGQKPFTLVEDRQSPAQSRYGSANLVGVQTPQIEQSEKASTSAFRPVSFDARSSPFANTPRQTASMQSMNSQLERIKFAKEKAMRTLKNVSNLQQKSQHVDSSTKLNAPQNQSKSLAKSRLDETEEFVKNILDSCGMQALSI